MAQLGWMTILLAACLVVPSACFSSGRIECVGDAEELVCLRRNFDSLFSEQYDVFWEIANRRGREVASCQRRTVVEQFLPLADKVGNAEFAEFYHETIESLASTSPLCLAEAWSRLGEPEQVSVVRVLRAPLFKSAGDLARSAQNAGVPKKFPKLAKEMGW